MARYTQADSERGYFSLADIPEQRVDAGIDKVLCSRPYNFTLSERKTGGMLERSLQDGLRETLVVLGGEGRIRLALDGINSRDEILQPNDGVYLPAGAVYSIEALSPMQVLSVTSALIPLKEEYINELAKKGVEEQEKQRFQWTPSGHFFSLDAEGQFERVYHVDKPWGGEDWLTVLNDGHVLKRITMVKGNQCSLQTHYYKHETNYVVNGTASVLLVDQWKDIGPQSGWHVHPEEMHRVFAQDTYTAFEASTPEVRDVVRHEDDFGRANGYIATEHKQQ
jgi:mannose-6-phosphate isomerase-like protein (cupin superfamily)